jgi:hypothetical protein
VASDAPDDALPILIVNFLTDGLATKGRSVQNCWVVGTRTRRAGGTVQCCQSIANIESLQEIIVIVTRTCHIPPAARYSPDLLKTWLSRCNRCGDRGIKLPHQATAAADAGFRRRGCLITYFRAFPMSYSSIVSWFSVRRIGYTARRGTGVSDASLIDCRN